MTKSNIEIRPSTMADIEAFNKGPAERTARAFSVFRDGELVAIAGVTIEPSRIVAFSDIKEGVSAPKTTVWRTAKELLKRIQGFNLPIVAISSQNINNSDRFLECLGFQHIGDAGGEKIYRLL